MSEVSIGERILIVDEHEQSALVLRLALGRRGHLCEHALHSDEAMSIVVRFRPTVVLFEWALRDGTGRGLASLIRGRCAEARRSPVIIALSHLDEPVVFRREEAIDDYITKPETAQMIEQTFARHLRRRQLPIMAGPEVVSR